MFTIKKTNVYMIYYVVKKSKKQIMYDKLFFTTQRYVVFL